MSINFYETRPVIVQAVEFTGNNAEELNEFTNGAAKIKIIEGEPVLSIDTLEGTMLAPVGSYVIKGTMNEFYPCIAEVFNKKYKLAEGSINN